MSRRMRRLRCASTKHVGQVMDSLCKVVLSLWILNGQRQ